MKAYNGHRSWNAWNVSLWVNNDENNYLLASAYVKQFGAHVASRLMLEVLPTHTPDGARYNQLCLRLVLQDIRDSQIESEAA